jgi:hypothetical protein
MKLYHYTCRHAADAIVKTRVLLPQLHPLVPNLRPTVWLTDLDTPDRNALGLTSRLLHCDRTEYRVTVDADADHWPRTARSLGRAERAELESAPGAMPMHWYLCHWPVAILEIGQVTP